MKRAVLLSLAAAFALTVMFVVAVDEAHAIPQFSKEFKAKYVDAESSDPVMKDFAVKVKKAKCNICHVGKKKKNRNAYGDQLSELLDKKKDKKDKEKIQASLDTVAEMKVDPEDENSPTYADLFAAGEIPPAGEEPAAEEESEESSE